MAMTPNEKANFEAGFNELRGNLASVTPNDKSENTRALWGIVWMMAQLNQDLIGIYQELDFTNQVARTQSDALSKQAEDFQKRLQEAQKDAPKNWEEFTKNFTEAYDKARKEAEDSVSPENRKKAADNLRKLADELENLKPDEDLSEKLKHSNLHPIEKEDAADDAETDAEGKAAEDTPAESDASD